MLSMFVGASAPARVPPPGGAVGLSDLSATASPVALDPRDQAYHRLPRFVQPLLTLSSAIPASDASRPIIDLSRVTLYMLIAIQFVGSLVLAMLCAQAVTASSSILWFMLAFAGLAGSWLLMASAFRTVMTTALHDIVHMMEPIVNKKTDRIYKLVLGWLGEFLCIALFLLTFPHARYQSLSEIRCLCLPLLG